MAKVGRKPLDTAVLLRRGASRGRQRQKAESARDRRVSVLADAVSDTVGAFVNRLTPPTMAWSEIWAAFERVSDEHRDDGEDGGE